MRLTQATPQAIRYACTRYHYAGNVPQVQYGYNVYNDAGAWCGVVCFGGGANKHIGQPYGLWQGEVLELTRVALNGKQETTSQCVSAALRELHRQNPLVRLVVSYADLDQGHAGTIYQATNWIYEGLKDQGKKNVYKIHGKAWHARTVGSKGWTCSEEWLRANVDPQAELTRTEGKHKYVYPMDRKMRRQLRDIAQPYPKK
jgi:hypothetical protein